MRPVCVLTILLLVGMASAAQHILLDTTKEAMLNYGSGWVAENFQNSSKEINRRSYVTCDIGYPNVNNWLWTGFIEKGEANRIYIETKFSIRNCSLFPGTLGLQCKESFSLLFHEMDESTY